MSARAGKGKLSAAEMVLQPAVPGTVCTQLNLASSKKLHARFVFVLKLVHDGFLLNV